MKFGIYVCLATALLWFQFERNKLERLMHLKEEEFKKHLIKSILRQDKCVLLTTIFFPEFFFFFLMVCKLTIFNHFL